MWPVLIVCFTLYAPFFLGKKLGNKIVPRKRSKLTQKQLEERLFGPSLSDEQLLALTKQNIEKMEILK